MPLGKGSRVAAVDRWRMAPSATLIVAVSGPTGRIAEASIMGSPKLPSPNQTGIARSAPCRASPPIREPAPDPEEHHT